MSYVLEHMAETLRSAREARGMSQRDLSAKSGVPQSHISKIESGAVDLRLSSLVELARVLDLEVAIVPRKTLPALQAIVRSSGGADEGDVQRRANRELSQLQNFVSKLPEQVISRNEAENYVRIFRDLKDFRLSNSELKKIRNSALSIKNIKPYLSGTGNVKIYSHKDAEFSLDKKSMIEFFGGLKEIKNIRNSIVHGVGADRRETVRPAYSLDEDDDG